MSEMNVKEMPPETTIKVKKTTRDELAMLGHKGESWDSIVKRLIDFWQDQHQK
jgi:hypothetical protein